MFQSLETIHVTRMIIRRTYPIYMSDVGTCIPALKHKYSCLPTISYILDVCCSIFHENLPENRENLSFFGPQIFLFFKTMALLFPNYHQIIIKCRLKICNGWIPIKVDGGATSYFSLLNIQHIQTYIEAKGGVKVLLIYSVWET